jgi:hypothetical protein
MGKGIAVVCDSDSGLPKALFYSCNVTNTCALSVTEIGEALLKNFSSYLTEFSVSTQLKIAYEGRSKTGETVKIDHDKSITVERGLLGQSGPSF